jgi:glycosyltransferase involved in cell wall biosynthesis
MNANPPLISVIIPCFNLGYYLNDALDSVLKQTYSYWECVIIDNASNDNTKEVALQYMERDSRFRYIFQEVKGVSAARNKGVKNSIGKYILPLDADDKIAPSYLEKAIAIIEGNEDIKVVFCEAKQFGARSKKWKLPTYTFRNLLIENCIFCTALFSRESYISANGYDENFLIGFEDWDFWISLLSKGGKVVKIKEVLFFYRIRRNSRNNSLNIENQRKLRMQIFEKHLDLYTINFNMSDLIFELHQFRIRYSMIINLSNITLIKKFASALKFIKKCIGK